METSVGLLDTVSRQKQSRYKRRHFNTALRTPKVYCRDCARYDSETRKCKDSKVNPQRWETAVEVANVLGLRSICVFNDFREKLVHARTNTLQPIRKTRR